MLSLPQTYGKKRLYFRLIACSFSDPMQCFICADIEDNDRGTIVAFGGFVVAILIPPRYTSSIVEFRGTRDSKSGEPLHHVNREEGGFKW